MSAVPPGSEACWHPPRAHPRPAAYPATYRYLLGRGVHSKIVQTLLGHSTVTLTLDTYSHVIPSFTQEVAEHMDALFGSSQKIIEGALPATLSGPGNGARTRRSGPIAD